MKTLSEANVQNEKFKVKIYTKLMENYNVFPDWAVTMNAQRKINDVCACLDCRDTPVIIGSCSDGTMLQFTLDQDEEAGFIPKGLGLTGKNPALGLASDKKSYLFAIKDRKVWYAFEDKPGSNKFGYSNSLEIPGHLSSCEPVRIFCRNIRGKLYVGVVVSDSGGYSLAYCGDFKSGSHLIALSDTRANLDTYDFMFMEEQIYTISVTGNQLRMRSLQGAAEYYTLPITGEFTGLRWVTWLNNTGRIIVIVKQDGRYFFGEIKLSGNVSAFTRYHELPENCDLTVCSVIRTDSATVHMLFNGSKIYHAFLKDDVACNPIPIESGGGKAAFLETNHDRAEFYIADSVEDRIVQLCQNNSGNYISRFLNIPWNKDESVITTPCYSTELHITDNNDAPLINQAFSIWAQDDVYVQTERGTHRLGPRNDLTLYTNARGVAIFIQQTDNIASTILCLRVGEYMKKDEVIYLRQHDIVSNNLKNLPLQKFIHAKTGNGEYLLPEKYRNETEADKILKSIKSILSRTPGESNAPDAVGAYHANTADENYISRISPSESSFTFSIADNGSLSYSCLDTEAFNKMTSAGSKAGYTPILTNLGDLCRGISNDLVKMDSLSLDSTRIYMELTINNEKYSYSGTIPNGQGALDAVSSVFGSIGVKFKKFFSWLGFLFDWNDFIRMKKLCDYLSQKTLTYIKNRSDYYRETFDRELTNMQSMCGDCLDKLKNETGSNSIFSRGKAKYPEDPELTLETSNNFLLEKTAQYMDKASVTIPVNLMNEIMGDVGVISNELKEYSNGIRKSNEYGGIDSFLKNKYTSSSNLYNVAFSALIDLLKSLSNIVFDGLKNLNTLIFRVIGEIIDAVLAALKSPFYIPYVSKVYKKFTGTDLTISDICSFLAAVTATIVYKFIKNEPPIASDAALETLKRSIDSALTARDHDFTPQKDLSVVLKYIGLGASVISNIFDLCVDALKDLKTENNNKKNDVDFPAVFIWGLDAISLVCYFPKFHGESDWEWIWIYDLVVLGFDGVSITYENKYITQLDWGVGVTAVIGFIRVIINSIGIGTGMEKYDWIAGIVQGIQEIFKILLIAKNRNITVIVVFADIINMAVQVIAAVFDILEKNDGTSAGAL
ncbi:MAG: hypothetical protein FWC19_04935 [Treponema sp.]|nr:hypothetical protein [Treponema sp.]MCL2272134.1 hypothetical protein [Treponema sp.]